MTTRMIKGLSVGAAVVMITAGLGLTRLVFPHQSELMHHLEAAAGELLGLAALFVIALMVRRQVEPDNQKRSAPPAESTGQPHPLAS